MFGCLVNTLRRLRRPALGEPRSEAVLSTSEVSLIPATEVDVTFVTRAYQTAQDAGAVAKLPELVSYIGKCIGVSQRTRPPELHGHPFAVGQPAVLPIDDIFLLKKDESPIGVLWLRDYNDFELLESEWFGELIFLWISPEFRTQKTWPQIAPLVKSWASKAKKTHLMGRCLKPSRRMAALFEQSGFIEVAVTRSGMSVHEWRAQGFIAPRDVA